MKVLISEKFKKSVPNEKKEVVKNKIKQLNDEIKKLENENKSIRDISKGFSIWKIKNAKEDIYKFRVDQSNRIIFTFTKCLSNWGEIDEYEDENNIHILQYCTHDEQILRAKNINLDGLGYIDIEDMQFSEEIEQDLYDLEDEKYYNTNYNPMEDKISIYSSEDLEKIFGMSSREEIYKLNEKQKIVLRAECPVFLFGSAGSGKTTIAVRKIRNICDSNPDMKVGYFTFSNNLKIESKKIFDCLGKYNKKNKNTNIQFYSIEEYLKKISNNNFDISITNENKNNKNHITRDDNDIEVCYMCKYHNFEKWVYDNNIKKQMQIEDYDLFEIYIEIRGIIKGMIGIDWCQNDPNLYKRSLMDKDYYLNLKPEYSSYKDKEKVYELARRYQNWLSSNEKLFDDNDLTVEAIERIENGDVEKFDFVVVDEIQDLTEKQIYMIYNLVKDPQNVFFAGDYHQTINATYFNTHRIKTLFTVNEEAFTGYNLDLNYRSHKEIVELSKRVSDIRIEKLYQDRKNDYTERYLDSDDDRNYKPILLKKDKENKQKMLEVVDDRHYAAVIVPDEVEKKKFMLENEKNLENSKVMTVSEIKGIERDVIVCYNMISRNYDEWEKIMRIDSEKEGFEKQYIYRPYFNKLYVAITRARKQVCFYEDKESKILNLLSDEGRIEVLDRFDENRFNLNILSTSDDHISAGLDYENNNKYDIAIKEYKKSTSINKNLYIERCEAYNLLNDNKTREAIKVFNSVGNKFFNRGMFEDALKCFNESGNTSAQIKCMVALNNDWSEIQEKLNQRNINIFDAIFDYNELDKKQNDSVIASFLNMCNEYIYEKSCEKIEELSELYNLL